MFWDDSENPENDIITKGRDYNQSLMVLLAN